MKGTGKTEAMLEATKGKKRKVRSDEDDNEVGSGAWIQKFLIAPEFNYTLGSISQIIKDNRRILVEDEED